MKWVQKDGFNHKVEIQLLEHIDNLVDNNSKDSMVEVEFLNVASMTKPSSQLLSPQLFNSMLRLVISERRQEETAAGKPMGWCLVIWFLISSSNTTILLLLGCRVKFKISTVQTLVVVFVGTPYNSDSLSHQT